MSNCCIRNREKKLIRLYNMINWIDFGIVVSMILAFIYAVMLSIGYSNPIEFIQATNYNPHLVDDFIATFGEEEFWFFIMYIMRSFGTFNLILYLMSLSVGTIAIFLTVKLRKERFIGRFRIVFRFISWGIFIPVDLIGLYSLLFM